MATSPSSLRNGRRNNLTQVADIPLTTPGVGENSLDTDTGMHCKLEMHSEVDDDKSTCFQTFRQDLLALDDDVRQRCHKVESQTA